MDGLTWQGSTHLGKVFGAVIFLPSRSFCFTSCGSLADAAYAINSHLFRALAPKSHNTFLLYTPHLTKLLHVTQQETGQFAVNRRCWTLCPDVL